MPDYVIREATDDDGPALAALLSSVWSSYDGCVFDAADESVSGRPAHQFSEGGGRLWVLTTDDAVSGSLGVLPSAREGDFELRLVCLDPGSRGQGFATAMLAGADAFAAASGGERLTLWVDTRLVEGIRFAERKGFAREPGVKARHDGSDALEARFTRDVETGLSLQLSEAPPASGA